MSTRSTSPDRARSVGGTLTIDWGQLAPLRLRARALADGVYAGSHRSQRRGSGVEFSGHRAYVPGDDLRLVDRRALLRHDKLMVRELETDTDRVLHLLLDGSASMAYRGRKAPGAKLAYAALVAAALTRIAIAGGDRVALHWFGGADNLPLPAAGGREAFERVVAALEGVRADGKLAADDAALERALVPLTRSAGRGSVVVVFSDLLDLPEIALDRLSALGGGGRSVVVVEVLDPAERHFDFSGAVLLESIEGTERVETDAEQVRESYLAALAAHGNRWSEALVGRRGRLVRATTSEDPVDVVRSVLDALAGGAA